MPRTKSPFFQCKQFRVWHDRSTLKVCTEACILGSYVPVEQAHHVLDIGTGTGLLALMMAQRNPTLTLDALEIDEESATQAQSNVAESPFASQISVHFTTVQAWNPSQKYDLVVSNPPFYTNHLPTNHLSRQRALHTETLSGEDLISAVARLMSRDGKFVVLMPPFQTQQLVILANDFGLSPTCQLNIFQRADAPLFRQITTFERIPKPLLSQNFSIYAQDQSYSAEFQTLLKDYYTIF